MAELKDFLYNLATENDNDFNGTNGEEYLWEEAKEKGYDNNLDYVVEYILENRDYATGVLGLNQYTTDFLYYWMGKDSYYTGCEFNLIEVYGTFVVSIAWETNV